MVNEHGSELRTREEIEKLKRDWLADGVWDIEDTEGFQAHREELLAFSRETEARCLREAQERAAADVARWRRRAEALGCTASLVQVIEGLERRVAALREKVEGRGT
jgi:hypothetical protein